MANEQHPVYCSRCGSLVQAGDRFCGVCGAGVPPDAQEAIPTEQVPTQVPPPPSIPNRRRNRKLINGVMVGVLLIVLLAGAGAVVLTKFGSGTDLSGGAKEERAPSGTSGSSGGFSVSPDAPPDPAFDLPLEALVNLTEAPIMLPAELPNELKNVGIDENFEGDRYGIIFLTTPPEDLVGGWPTYKIVGSLQAVPISEFEPTPGFKVTSTEDVRLPDGTDAKLRYMEPSGELVNYTAQWEGTFDKGGYTYTLSSSLARHGKDILTRALSTMVLVPGSGEQTVDLSNDTSPPAELTGSTESTSSTSPPGSEDQLRKAVEDYYEAVDREDWAYTYDHLDSETRSVFTRGEWYQKNQWYAEHYPQDLESIEVLLNGSATGSVVSVTVYRTFKDGTSLGRDTFFVFENGEWKHRFGQEENNLYMPDASYEEFVKAQ